MSNKNKMKISPRVINALGKDLVTNNIIAIIELVKNAYDAFSKNVSITINQEKDYIKIVDDGIGMSKEMVENVWATIGTDYKIKNPVIKSNGGNRHVTGNKGIGRLSSARLGNVLTMETITEKEVNIKDMAEFEHTSAIFNWDFLADQNSFENCEYTLNSKVERSSCQKTGTTLTISDLRDDWTIINFQNLKSELSRFISPFDINNEFSIRLKFNEDEEVIVEKNKFLDKPVYRIEGSVNDSSLISYKIEYIDYANISTIENANISESLIGEVEWSEIWMKVWNDEYKKLYLERYPIIKDEVELRNLAEKELYNDCGPFNFEIRVWEVSQDYLETFSKVFGINKSNDIKKLIEQNRGVSVYRNNVLAMPKTDSARDWIGLDKRQISNLGRRLSSRQIIGIVHISNELNPNLKDTTNREGLEANKAYDKFVELLVNGVINKVEEFRNRKKVTIKNKPRIKDYFDEINPEKFIEETKKSILNNDPTEKILKNLDKYKEKTAKSVADLKIRVEAYAQLASAGTLSSLIVHEIDNALVPIDRYTKLSKKKLSPIEEPLETYSIQAIEGYSRLNRLSKTFMPLSSRKFRQNKYSTNLNENISNTLDLFSEKLIQNKIEIQVNCPKTFFVSCHPGEVQTILVNLIDNAIYWLNFSSNDIRVLSITATSTEERIYISVNDNGPGIEEEESELIFEPGVTSKTTGFGMGLVVVNELVSYHNGSLKTIIPGNIGGATFVFDLPQFLEKGENS